MKKQAKAGNLDDAKTRLMPIENAPRKKRFGLLQGQCKVSNSFDAPLDPRVLALFQGR